MKMATNVKFLKALLWPVATYGCDGSDNGRTGEETRIDAFEMKCLRFVLGISWTENRTNDWVLQLAGTERHLLKSVKKENYILWTHNEEERDKCLLREGNDPRYNTGCPHKGQTENKLLGQYQTLDGAVCKDC